MSVHVRQQGSYELFETTKHHRILSLDGKQWYAWVKGQAGEILVRSDSDHKKSRSLQTGSYFLIDFDDDPKFKDTPHLFLQDGGHYQELMVPNGLPTDRDYQKKVIATGDTIGRKRLEEYLQHPAPSGPGEERMSRPGGGAISNVTHHLKGIDFPARKSQVISHARKGEAPKAVLEQLDHLPERKYDNMAEITRGIKEGQQAAGEKLPIDNYDRLHVEQVTRRLDDLEQDEIAHLLDYERNHKNRKTLRQAFERRLS